MKSLIWKEWRENFKWLVLPTLLILGPMTLFGVPMLMEETYLAYVSLVVGLFGALLGFLQVFAESRGDKRSLLLHRPLSRSRIFLGKVIAGLGLYLLAVAIPSTVAVGLAATPGHVAAPFDGPMVLPWLADILTGLVYYFAGMLSAQRQARWYGSRCLPLAAGVFASLVVWNLPEFWHAILAIGVLSALVALAAWGSILTGGDYAIQPPLAKLALAVVLLLGLSTLGFAGKVTIGLVFEEAYDYPFELDRRGRLFVIHKTGPRITSVTDLAGRVPEGLRGERPDWYAINEIRVRAAMANPLPKAQSYRNPGRCLLGYTNETTPKNEAWWYVPAVGRILGYDKDLKHFLGSFCPDGFVPPDGRPSEQFKGDVAQRALGFEATARNPLAFPDSVFTVDFHTGTIRKLFVAPPGETVRWASSREDEREKWSMFFVGTDKAVYFLDSAGSQLCSADLAYDQEMYQVLTVGRLVNPDRYWGWYFPQAYLPLETRETIPEVKVLIYDSAGRESQPRQDVPPRPGSPATRPSQT